MNHLVFSFPILNFARRTIAPALLFGCALYVLAQLGAPPQTVRAAGVFTGTVFRDYNANGAQDSREPGVGGVRVTFYDSSNTVPQNNGFIDTFAVVCAGAGVPAGSDTYGRSCTGPGTPALGSWSLTPSGTASTGPFRVEFTNVPGYLQPGANPSGLNQSQTSVQFAADGGGTVNLGLNDPSQYVNTTSPTMVTNAYIWGSSTGATQTAMYSWNYTLNSTPAGNTTDQGTSESTHGQIGATWGLAYRRTTNTIYAAAYLKRLAGFGPGLSGSDGSGTVYAVTPNGAGADNGTPFVDIDNALGGNQTGNNLHGTTFTCNNAGTLSCDANAFTPPDTSVGNSVGKASLGDLEISGDESKMWTVNLFNQHLIEIQFAGPTIVDRGSIPTQTTVSCTNGVARPFGLGWKDGLLYVGGVCDESTSGSGTATSNLRAWVYTFNPTTNTFSTSPVVDTPLTYNRTCLNRDTYGGALPNCNAGTPLTALSAPRALWHPWTENLNRIVVNNDTYGSTDRTVGYAQPILSDIVFDNQDMILGFRDRTGDLLGYNDPGPNSTNPISGNPSMRTLPGGDILRFNPSSYSGSTVSGWALESASASNPTGIFGPTGGATNYQGNGNGEFYYQDTGPKGSNGTGGTEGHQETSLGGLAQVPGFSEVALTAYSPRFASTIGQIQLNNAGATPGQWARLVQVVGNHDNGDPSGPNASGGNFSKTNGLGDLVALMAPAPIEIGNRVWNDANGNGRQDAGESGISGVVVGLYDSGGTFIASVTTDTNGNFLFSSASGTDVTGKNYGLTISPATQYTIAVFNTNFNSGQALFSTPYRTTANFDGQTNNNAFTDIRDSDGINLPSNVGNSGAGTLASIGVTLATSVITGAGYNNDSVDFGFRSTPTAASLVSFRARPAKVGVKVRWQTGSELQITGFNVWRQTGTGKWKQLNAEIISAKHMGGIQGAAYRFRDKSANTDKVYRYKLEILNASGEPAWSDVVKVR